MAIKERNVALVSKDTSGDTCIDMPLTTVEQVEGLATVAISGKYSDLTGLPTITTYSAMTGATSSAAGKTGLVPAPAAGAQVKYLRGDGTWQTPPDTNTTYSAMTGATSSAAGKTGLVPAPAAGAQVKYLCGDGTWQTPPDTNTTYGLATQSANGLMSASDKAKLDGLGSGVSNTIPYGICTTAANKPKVVTVTGDFTLTAGQMVLIKFNAKNTYTGTVTLNVNGTGEIALNYKEKSRPDSELYGWVLLVYNGDNKYEVIISTKTGGTDGGA